MLDAPVSGSVPQVQSGTLTIMVGGDKRAYDQVEAVLEVLGSPTYIGDNGQGLVPRAHLAHAGLMDGGNMSVIANVGRRARNLEHGLNLVIGLLVPPA